MGMGELGSWGMGFVLSLTAEVVVILKPHTFPDRRSP